LSMAATGLKGIFSAAAMSFRDVPRSNFRTDPSESCTLTVAIDFSHNKKAPQNIYYDAFTGAVSGFR